MLGEGLQHADGHSPLLASVNPACVIYDPAFAYELAIILEDAVKRILGPEAEDRFWYITLYNENYPMPALPGFELQAGATQTEGSDHTEEVRKGILAGAYRFAGPSSDSGGTGGTGSADEANGSAQSGRRRNGRNNKNGARKATLLFSGSAWRAVSDARDMLAADWNVEADSWSVTSYTELRREAMSIERWNRLHPNEEPRLPFITRSLGDHGGPVVAVSDYIRAVPDQISRYVERQFVSLGTDGFGRSDTREALRSYFEVDAPHVVLGVLAALVQEGEAKPDEVAEAISRYGLQTESPDPWKF